MRIMGRRRALVGVLAGSLLLAGCNAGPGQVGAAVIVGGKTVSVDRVQQLIDKAVREHPYGQQLAKEHKLDLVGREIVRQEILHDLTERAAQREGVRVDEALVVDALQNDPLAKPMEANPQNDPALSVQQLVARVRDHRESLVDAALQTQLAMKYLDKLTVTFDFSSVSSTDATGSDADKLREQAIEKARKFAASPNAAAELIAQDQQTSDTQAGTGQKLPAMQSPATAATVLFGLEPNTVAAFQPTPQQPLWVVVVVRERTADKPVASDQAAQPSAQQLAGVGIRLLQPYLDQVDLKVNPRYGVWDVVGMDLAPNEASKKGIVLPVHGAAPQNP
ncbi:hypothetical protein GCM10027598_26410 [Amycolatopsis oliviviridis]|uniref:SurA N-terminal domain-containing protein n=1 Tax=Amycolatopsis oliviviridis TaxID=1471590 RepID=A0ABQ3LK39_9PSEU|nr:hypothetical protein [Amycolatopsis oliviviridis]GHH17289.1 hypothetical protein GCM10017790_34060 [Amycolatopsis oliviviridis]